MPFKLLLGIYHLEVINSERRKIMKILNRILIGFVLSVVLLFVLSHQVSADNPVASTNQIINGDKVVFSDTFTLGKGDIVTGNLTLINGEVTLEVGSQVTGDVVVLGGTLSADGEILGNLSALSGSVFLGKDSVIHGNLSMLGGTLHQISGAQILGQQINGWVSPLNISIPQIPTTEKIFSGFKPIANFLGAIINILIMGALAILVTLLWPRSTDRVARAIGNKPLITGGLGLLTIVVLPAMLIIVMITIILIPVSLLGFLGLLLAMLFGWIAVGLELGKRLTIALKKDWQPAISACLGTILITLIANFVGAIPCVGWLVPFFIAVIGLGGVILTRFGYQDYPTSPSALVPTSSDISSNSTAYQPPTPG
jgi:hypothetical protein